MTSSFRHSLGDIESELTVNNSVLANLLWLAKMNRDKKMGKYDQYASSGDDRDPEFEMIL